MTGMAKRGHMLKSFIATSVLLICLHSLTLHAQTQSTHTGIHAQDQALQKVYVEGVGVYFIIKPHALHKMMEEKDFLLVNVHIPYEGEIKKTDLFVSYLKIREHLDRFPGGRDSKIVLYCRSDRMSSIAAHTLLHHGYSRIFVLKGGMIAWQRAGYPLISR